MFNRLRVNKLSVVFGGSLGAVANYFIAHLVSFPHYWKYLQHHKDNVSFADCIVNQYNQLESTQQTLLESQARAYAEENTFTAGYILVGFLMECVLAYIFAEKIVQEKQKEKQKELVESKLTLQERLEATGWKEIPDGLKDPVTFDLLDNPFLIVESGHSFNPNTLEMLLDNRCPITRMPFFKPPIPNHALRKASEDYVLEKEEWAKEQREHNNSENKCWSFKRFF